MNLEDQKVLSQSAALILGKVALSLFPEVQLIQSHVYGSSIAYDFLLSQKISEEHLPLFQNELSKALSEEIEFYPLEMIPSNAAELFKSQRQFLKEEQLLDESQPLVHLVKIGDHYDVTEGQTLQDFQGHIEVLKLSLLETKHPQVKGYTYRLFGIVGRTCQEIKKEKQKLKEQDKFSHLKVGEALKLFTMTEKSLNFLPKGAQALDNLQNKFTDLLLQYRFQKIIRASNSKNQDLEIATSLFQENNKTVRLFRWQQSFEKDANPFLKGLRSLKKGLENRVLTLCSQSELEEECIYCLKFYLEIIKILGFSYEIHSSYKEKRGLIENVLDKFQLPSTLKQKGSDEIEIVLKDKWERSLETIYLKVKEIKHKIYSIEGTLVFSLEKILGALIEENKGMVPPFISSEQVRILCLEGAKDFAYETYDYLRANSIQVQIDQSQENLNVRLHKALKEKVPYVAILGKQEEKEKQITFRTQAKNREFKLSKEDLLQELIT